MEEQQSSFRRITKAVCSIDGAYDMLSKELGVKGNLLWLLYTLDDGALHSQKQICEDWLFPRTTINTLIKECQNAGYLTLHTIPGRKRELHIRLTAEGQAYARRLLGPIYKAEAAALENTLQAPSEDFITQLEVYAQNLKDALTRAAGSRKDNL